MPCMEKKIAVASGKNVYIYRPHVKPEEKDKVHTETSIVWSEFIVLEQEEDTKCVAWKHNEQQILVGCENKMFLWDVSKISVREMRAQGQKLLWTRKIFNPIYEMKFSPNDDFVATCGKHDKMAKIWYQYVNPFSQEKFKDGSENDNLRFVYLPHPRGVRSFEWRETRNTKRNNYNKSAVQDVLLTGCADNVNRLWMKIENYENDPRPNFHLVNLVGLSDSQSSDQHVAISWVKAVTEPKKNKESKQSGTIENSHKSKSLLIFILSYYFAFSKHVCKNNRQEEF